MYKYQLRRDISQQSIFSVICIVRNTSLKTDEFVINGKPVSLEQWQLSPVAATTLFRPVKNNCLWDLFRNSKIPLKQIQNLTIRWNSNIDYDIYRIFNAYPLYPTSIQKYPQNSHRLMGIHHSPHTYHGNLHENFHTHGSPAHRPISPPPFSVSFTFSLHFLISFRFFMSP